MSDLTERVAAIESMFAKVNLGDWSNDQDVPWWVAWRIRPVIELQASLVSAIHLAAQLQLGKDTGGSSQLLSEIVDEWCGTKVPGRFPPRPHWGSVVEQLGLLADRYPAGSALRNATFELGRRVIERAQELGGKAR